MRPSNDSHVGAATSWSANRGEPVDIDTWVASGSHDLNGDGVRAGPRPGSSKDLLLGLHGRRVEIDRTSVGTVDIHPRGSSSRAQDGHPRDLAGKRTEGRCSARNCLVTDPPTEIRTRRPDLPGT